MTTRRLPLWHFRDVLCFLGVWLTFHAFFGPFRRLGERAAADPRLVPSRSDFHSFAGLLAIAEAWLDFAIARRAFALAGLDASRVRFAERSPASVSTSLGRRACLYLDRLEDLDAAASAMAAGIRQAMASAALGPVDRHPAQTEPVAPPPAWACAATRTFTPAWTRGIAAPP